MKKRCTFCNRLRPLSSFNKHHGRKDGRQTHCRQCGKEQSAAWYSRNQKRHRETVRKSAHLRRAEARALVLEYLKTHPCTDCGETDIVVLQFDHVKGTKVAAVGTLIGQGCVLKVLEAEIAKCVVRCANCHTRVTFKRLKRCYRFET